MVFPFSSPATGLCDDSVPLRPARDVVVASRGFVATSREPWLRLEVDAESVTGRWIELTYDGSLLQPLARPILRCRTDNGEIDHILTGPLFGRAIWLGR